MPHPKSEGKNKQYITVACRKCETCLTNRKNEWSIRMLHESNYHSENTCCTLTYDEEHVPQVLNESTGELLNTLDKRDFQLFLKRLRKQIQKTYQKKIRYFLGAEYGDITRRPHAHAILFGVGKKMVPIDWILPSRRKNSAEIKADKEFAELKKIITEAWGNGHVNFGEGQNKDGAVNQRTIEYTAKYILKSQNQNIPECLEKPFQLFSKGLGLKWVQQYGRGAFSISAPWNNHRKGTLWVNGYQKSAPKYYLQKAFTEEELKALKEERTPEYIKVLQRHEKTGSGTPDALKWAREQEYIARSNSYYYLSVKKAKQQMFGSGKRNKI
jgi:hypothetical protein